MNRSIANQMIDEALQGETAASLVDAVIEAKQKLTGWVKKAVSGKDFSTTDKYDTPDKARRAIAAGLFKKIGKYHQR